uniref:Uncharacterized protein n=1 Tax=Rhizophora mucronata TaxID=61149 RepID=A0A2P2PQ51_RHIMU
MTYTLNLLHIFKKSKLFGQHFFHDSLV